MTSNHTQGDRPPATPGGLSNKYGCPTVRVFFEFFKKPESSKAHRLDMVCPLCGADRLCAWVAQTPDGGINWDLIVSESEFYEKGEGYPDCHICGGNSSVYELICRGLEIQP